MHYQDKATHWSEAVFIDDAVYHACKPKVAAPKRQYIERISASARNASSDPAFFNGVQYICDSLERKMHADNPVVVFRTLLVFHAVIRDGTANKMLGYLAAKNRMGLQNLTVPESEKYHPPVRAVKTYATYLELRIRAYHALQRDVVSIAEAHAISGAEASGSSQQLVLLDESVLVELRWMQKLVECLLKCNFQSENLMDPLVAYAANTVAAETFVLYKAISTTLGAVPNQLSQMPLRNATTALELCQRYTEQTPLFVSYAETVTSLQGNNSAYTLASNIPLLNANTQHDEDSEDELDDKLAERPHTPASTAVLERMKALSAQLDQLVNSAQVPPQ